MLSRPRRNRNNENIRALVEENKITPNDLIAPVFFVEGKNQRIPIKSMPGHERLSLDLLVEKVKGLESLGIPCVSLFPAISEELKTKNAKEALNPDNLNLRAVKEIKNACPNMVVMTDVALDPYSSDGHDGLVDPRTNEILNDESVEVLAQMALLQAKAGSDIVGPSDMMDGRVLAIRKILDENHHKNTLIMSYTAKYASAFYGPFRDALDSAPKAGDKKTYQMNPANSREALRELYLDEKEGADIVMVKPGLPYLDVIKLLRDNTTLPVAAYNVSGEYAMIKAAAMNGWLDEKMAMVEMLTSFKRAGADMILTYFAEDMARLF